MVSEVMGWLSRQWRIDWTDAELYDDWGRMLDTLRDEEARKAKAIMEVEYTQTYKPTPALFLSYIPGKQRAISTNINHNPGKYWTENGVEYADLTQRMPQMISNPLKASEAKERAQGKIRGYAGKFNTPLALQNRMLKKQGLPTHKTQQEWDAKIAEGKSKGGVC